MKVAIFFWLCFSSVANGDQIEDKLKEFVTDAYSDIKKSSWTPTALGYSRQDYTLDTPYGGADVNIGEFSFTDYKLSDDKMEIKINMTSTGLMIKTDITLLCSNPTFNETRVLSTSTNGFGMSLKVVKGAAGRYETGKLEVELGGFGWKTFQVSNGTVNNVTQYIMGEMFDSFKNWAQNTYQRRFQKFLRDQVKVNIVKLDSIFTPPDMVVVPAAKLNSYFNDVINDLGSQKFTMNSMDDVSWNSNYKFSNFSLVTKNIKLNSEATWEKGKFYCEASLTVELDLNGSTDWLIPDSPGMHNVTETLLSETSRIKIEFGRDGKLSSGKVIPSFSDWKFSNIKVIGGNQDAVKKFVESSHFRDMQWMITQNVDKSLSAFVVSKFAAKQSVLD